MQGPVEGSGITPSYVPSPRDIQQKSGAMQLPEGETVRATRDLAEFLPAEFRSLTQKVKNLNPLWLKQEPEWLKQEPESSIQLAANTVARLNILKRNVQKSKRDFLTFFTELLGKRAPEYFKQLIKQDDRNECNRILKGMFDQGLITEDEYKKSSSFKEKKTFLNTKIEELRSTLFSKIPKPPPQPEPRPTPQPLPPIETKVQERKPEMTVQKKTLSDVIANDYNAFTYIKDHLIHTRNPCDPRRNGSFFVILNSNDKRRLEAFRGHLQNLLTQLQGVPADKDTQISRVQNAISLINTKLEKLT